MSDFILSSIGEELLKIIQGFANPFFDLYFGVLTSAGNTLPIIIILILLYYTINKEYSLRFAILLIFSAHFNIIAKIFFHNPRPYLHDTSFRVTTDIFGHQTIWGANGYSFPSGHSQTQGTVWSYIFSKYRNYQIMIIGIILLISIPISRCYLGVHWPSDILFGVIFGAFLTLIFLYLDKNYSEKVIQLDDSKKILLGMIGSIGLLIFGFIALIIGSLFPFNSTISLIDPHVWNEADLGTYPGMLAGVVIGQVLERKYVNFEIKRDQSIIILIRVIIGLCSITILYFIAKAVEGMAEQFQHNLIWITTLINFLAYFTIALFAAFIIPWVFTKIEKQFLNT
jgi:membrane-associated phospholipid phosphatase